MDKRLSHLHLVNCQTSVGTHVSAVGASNATIGILQIHIMIAVVVYFTRLQLEHMGGARHHTEIAALTSLRVYRYITLKFCHFSSGFLFLQI
jgi:hypothetical protein